MTGNIDTPSQCAPLHNLGCFKRWSNTYIFVWLDDSACDMLYIPVYMHLCMFMYTWRSTQCNRVRCLPWLISPLHIEGWSPSESGLHLSPTAPGFLPRFLSLLPWAVITGRLLCPPEPLCVFLGSELRSSKQTLYWALFPAPKVKISRS